MPSRPLKHLPPAVVVGVLAAAITAFGAVGLVRFRALRERDAPPPSEDRVARIHAWTDPAAVVHRSRFAFSFDPPEALRPLREEEALDDVVAGARTEEERLVRLMRWTRAQFEPAIPSPYAPPEARLLLSEIRSGRARGFCAHHVFLFVQAARSFGTPVRCVTIRKHEVAEAWLGEERRWVAFDPMNEVQVLDESGRSLSALEIRNAWSSGRTVRLSADNRVTEPVADYVARYERIAAWLRNDFVTSPMNYPDFGRYRLWFEPEGQDREKGSAALVTSLPEDLTLPPGP